MAGGPRNTCSSKPPAPRAAVLVLLVTAVTEEATVGLCGLWGLKFCGQVCCFVVVVVFKFNSTSSD